MGPHLLLFGVNTIPSSVGDRTKLLEGGSRAVLSMVLYDSKGVTYGSTFCRMEIKTSHACRNSS